MACELCWDVPRTAAASLDFERGGEDSSVPAQQ